MNKYDHGAKTIQEATGLDVVAVMKKARDTFETAADEDGGISVSMHMEAVETKLTHRELALVVAMLTREAESSVSKFGGLMRDITGKDDCQCEGCKARRALEEKEKPVAVSSGEGGKA